jgi:hypothetical protein
MKKNTKETVSLRIWSIIQTRKNGYKKNGRLGQICKICARLTSKFAKVVICLFKILKQFIKNVEFDADFISLGKVAKSIVKTTKFIHFSKHNFFLIFHRNFLNKNVKWFLNQHKI